MSDRVQMFAEAMGVGGEEARAWVGPLAGLNEAAFADHVAWLAKRKACMQEKAIAPTWKRPATDVGKTQAEVADFMSNLLDAQNREGRVATNTPASLPEDELDGVVEWFASRDQHES